MGEIKIKVNEKGVNEKKRLDFFLSLFSYFFFYQILTYIRVTRHIPKRFFLRVIFFSFIFYVIYLLKTKFVYFYFTPDDCFTRSNKKI